MERSEVWYGVVGWGGGVDRCPRQCPGVVNESRGMTDTPKPAASPSSSHPTAGPVGPTYITGLSPSNTTFTLPRLFPPGHQLGLCYAVKQMTGGMHIVFGAIHPWCSSPSQHVEGRGTSHAKIVWPLLQWEIDTIKTILSHFKKEIHQEGGKWNTKGKMS